MAEGNMKSEKSRSISITFPSDLFQRLNEDAQERGISFSRMVSRVCSAYYGRKVSYDPIIIHKEDLK